LYPKLTLPSYFDQESERLLYRRLVEEDYKSWSEFFVDNPNLNYLGADFGDDPEAAAKEWIHWQLERYENWGCGHLAVIEKASGEMIGMCGLLSREIEGKDEYEVAYSIKPAYWRKGYGTEMARHIKKFGIRNKLASRFVSMIHPENEGSIKVAINNGMKPLFPSTYKGIPVIVYGEEEK